MGSFAWKYLKLDLTIDRLVLLIIGKQIVMMYDENWRNLKLAEEIKGDI